MNTSSLARLSDGACFRNILCSIICLLLCWQRPRAADGLCHRLPLLGTGGARQETSAAWAVNMSMQMVTTSSILVRGLSGGPCTRAAQALPFFLGFVEACRSLDASPALMRLNEAPHPCAWHPQSHAAAACNRSIKTPLRNPSARACEARCHPRCRETPTFHRKDSFALDGVSVSYTLRYM